MMTYVGFAAAVAAIIGHVFPIYFGFKGGKGILVSVAVLMTVEWIPACILLGIFIIGKTNILTVKHSRKRKHRRVAFKFLSAYDRYFIGYAAVF